MATLDNFFQRFISLPDGKKLGIHIVVLRSSSDSFTVPKLDNSSSGLAVKQLVKNGDSALTITNSDAYTVTVAGGTEGAEVVIATLHEEARLNYVPETA